MIVEQQQLWTTRQNCWSLAHVSSEIARRPITHHIKLYSLEGRMEMFYLTTHSTHFIYGYMASNIWLRTILIVRKETCCRHIGYSFQLAARVLLYASSHRQDCTYHGLCYTSRGALAGMRNSSMGPPHEGSIRRPIAPWANALTTELHLAPYSLEYMPYIKKCSDVNYYANKSIMCISKKTTGSIVISSLFFLFSLRPKYFVQWSWHFLITNKIT